MTNRNASSTTRNGNTSLGRDGSSVLQSNASVFQPAMSKKHVKESENEFHVGGLRRPIQSLYMVPGWEVTGRRLWDCIDAALCNDMNASMLTRLCGQADFQGPLLELVEKVQNTILKEFALEPVATIKPSFGLPSTVRADILCGVMRVANDPDADTIQDWLVHSAPLGMDRKIETTGVFPPADKPDKEDDSPTPDVSEQLTVGGGHFKSVLENPRRCTQGVRQISGSSNRSGHRPNHSRTSLPKRTHQQIGAHHQRVTRKEESAPGCGHEAVQGKRTSSSARAANPASTVRRCGRLEGAVLGGCLSGFHVKNGRGVRKRHLRFFRRILPRAGAPRRAQELFSRGPSFSFWFRPRNRHDVSYGVWLNFF